MESWITREYMLPWHACHDLVASSEPRQCGYANFIGEEPIFLLDECFQTSWEWFEFLHDTLQSYTNIKIRVFNTLQSYTNIKKHRFESSLICCFFSILLWEVHQGWISSVSPSLSPPMARSGRRSRVISFFLRVKPTSLTNSLSPSYTRRYLQ